MAKNHDRRFMDRAIMLALDSEREGNLPVGAVITLDNEIISEGHSAVLEPTYHPGRHAEIMALRGVDDSLWPRARQMTCYSTLEPCVMCAGALLLHGVGRVVFGARDTLGGAGCILDHLPAYYDEGGVYEWEGPLMQKACEPLYRRADAAFAKLPVGREQWRKTDDGPNTADHYRAVLDRWMESPNKVRLRDARDAAKSLAERLDDARLAEVLPYLGAIFERTGYLKDFRALKRHARTCGQADFIGEVDEAVRENLPDVWIKDALRRGDLDAAIDCWFEYEEHRRARLCADQLIRACGDDHIELIISCRMSMVNYRIGRRQRRHYRRACHLLRRLRDELEAAGEPGYWRFVIEDVTTRYASRPALLDELEKAGFIDDDLR
jgi:tRNA(adenine34) deaminase